MRPPALEAPELAAWRAEHAELVDRHFLGIATDEDRERRLVIEACLEAAEAPLYADAIAGCQARGEEATRLARQVWDRVEAARRGDARARPRRIVGRGTRPKPKP